MLVLVIGALLIYNANKPAAQEGGKKLTVTVVHGDGSTKDFAFATDAENLRGALEEQKLIEGTESEYGLYVLTVDGETDQGRRDAHDRRGRHDDRGRREL